VTDHPSTDSSHVLSESLLEKKTFPSLALRMQWARGRNMAHVRFVSAVSEGLTKAMPPSSATGVAFVVRSHCGFDRESTNVREAVREYAGETPATLKGETPSLRMGKTAYEFDGFYGGLFVCSRVQRQIHYLAGGFFCLGAHSEVVIV